MGVTSLGRHTRPACHQVALAICWLKKVDFDLYTVCFSWTSGDARGLGLLFMVCACAVGLGGNVLIGMRGTWGVVWRSAHVPTIPFTWLRRAKALSPTAHASNHHATIGVFLWMRMFFIPWATWIFTTIYGHCDVNWVTWPIRSILIGWKNFCCALIGQSLKGPYTLLRWRLICRNQKATFNCRP